MTDNELTIEQLKGIAGGFETDRKPMSTANSQKDSVVVWCDMKKVNTKQFSFSVGGRMLVDFGGNGW